MQDVEDTLLPTVTGYIEQGTDTDVLWAAIEGQFRARWLADTDRGFTIADNVEDAWRWFRRRIIRGVAEITEKSDPRRVAGWLGTAIVNGVVTATGADTEGQKMWLSRRDGRVRPFHVEADGQTVGWSEPFTVCGGVEMLFPGDPVGDPSCWLNCRCVAVAADVFSLTAAAASFSVPAGVREEAVRGLEWRKEYKRGGTDVGLNTARILSGGGRVGLKKVRHIAKYFPRHEVDKQGKGWSPGEDGYPSNGRIAWALWGGDPGWRWARSIVERHEEMSVVTNENTNVFRADGDTINVDGVDDMLLPDDDQLLSEPYDDDEGLVPDAVPWFGVLAPEGVPSGDGRMFSVDALTYRDLPLPLRWQEVDNGGHDGAVTVGTIDRIWRESGNVMGAGLLMDFETADRIVGQIMDGALRGVSVDVDDAEMAADPSSEMVEFSRARICAATLVAIPAFPQTYLSLGEWGESDMTASGVFKDYTPDQRRDMIESGEAMPDGSYPIADCQDLRNAIQAIGRAKDPESVKKHISKRKNALGCDDVDLPESWSMTASGEFKRGTGWVTHPAETRRLHHYWTKGEGAAKIRWGTPGDFRRLRRALAKYINPMYLNRTVAQWHKDALGYWPGECGKPGNPRCGANSADVDGFGLVAAPVTDLYDPSWFANPQLDGPTPITITDDGRVYGHLALWDTCHIGIKGMCTTPPQSHADYAYFMTGAVHTTEGLARVGQLTMNTGHADLAASPAATAAHYDHTGTAIADVAVGDDEHGIWFAGAMRPGADEMSVRAFQAGSISGDWRAIGGNLELVAALVVNVPGFPIPRPALAASAGRQVSLVASGVQCAPEPASLPGEGEVPDQREARDAVVAWCDKQFRVARLIQMMQEV